MNTNRYIIVILLFVMSAFFACKKEKDEKIPVQTTNEMELTLEPGKWVYYRFSDRTVVGKSIIGNSNDDKEWYDRMDWDIALSENGIRTNSGESGRGYGGICYIDNETFYEDSYSHLSSIYYMVDTLNVPIVVPIDR